MQEPKDIVVYLDSVEMSSCASRIVYASTLAARWNAHLIVAFAPEELAFEPQAGFARGAAITSLLEGYQQRRRESEDVLRKMLDDVAAKADITTELRLCEGEIGEPFMLHARHAAIAVLGAGRPPDRQVSALTLSEDVIFASGRPSILLPANWPVERSAASKITVGWNASREAARAVSDAMPFLTAADKVHVVVVPEPKISRLLGQDPGADISRHLARHGIPIVLDRLEGENAGQLLLAKARDIGADMIVIGAYGQPKITEFVFGSATQTLLADPQIPILLSR
jgi:nucleotide-binding universal stress UspA family protein